MEDPDTNSSRSDTGLGLSHLTALTTSKPGAVWALRTTIYRVGSTAAGERCWPKGTASISVTTARSAWLDDQKRTSI